MTIETSTSSELSVSPLTSEVRAALGRVTWPIGACDREDFERVLGRCGIPERGALRVVAMLAGEPVRRVGGGRANVVVRYRSRKMRRVIQAESRSVELPFVLRCETNPRYLVYLCQPVRLRVWDHDRTGRRRKQPYVPDFLVVTEDSIELVGCKTVAELEADQERPYPRYTRNEDDAWRYPAADEAAQELGVVHGVVTSEAVKPLFVRNIEYLSCYVGVEAPATAGVESVAEMVRCAGSIRAAAVLAAPGVEPDYLWWLIANRHLWIDWERSLVCDPDSCWVHADEASLLSHTRLQLAEPAPADPVLSVRLETGAALLWDGVPWTVLNGGAHKVVLQKGDRSGEIVEIGVDSARELVRAGSLCADGLAEADTRARGARERIARLATTEEKHVAVGRWRALEHFAVNGKPPPGVSLPSIRRWKGWAKAGEKRFGSAYMGLLRRRGRSPGKPDMEPRERELLGEAARDFVRPRGKDGRPVSGTGTVEAAYRRLAERCDREGVASCPSLRSFRRAIKRERVAEVAQRRAGSGVGYQLEGPVPMGSGSTPPHGDRPFQFGLIDHVKCKVRLVSSRTGKVLGSVWLTVLVDAYSRMPLAIWVSFDDPARDRVLATLMDCARRHGRVPEYLCADQGSDFLSSDVEQALAVLGMHKQERPARKPRYGAVIERLFRSLDMQLVVEVPGSTKHLSFGRALSPGRHPDRQATWTLSEFHSYLERWLFEVYPEVTHTGIGQTPRERFEHGLAVAGRGVGRLVRYDRALEIELSVSPKKRTRTVDPGNGVTIMYLRYWHDSFSAGDVSGSAVEVRINPADASFIFARVKGEWVDCALCQGREEFLGRSWRQIRYAVQEMRVQIKKGVVEARLDAVTIGRFLRDVDLTSEGALARQIARDAEVPPTLRHGVRNSAEPGSRPKPPIGGGNAHPDAAAIEGDGEDDDFEIGELESFDEC